MAKMPSNPGCLMAGGNLVVFVVTFLVAFDEADATEAI